MKKTNKDIVIEVFNESKKEELKLKEINDLIKTKYPKKYSSYKNDGSFQSTIVNTIERYCKEMKYYGGKEGVFIRVKAGTYKLIESNKQASSNSHPKEILHPSSKNEVKREVKLIKENRKTYETSDTLKKEIIEESGYMCFLCNDKEETKRMSFQTSKGIYLEGHHVLPMSVQKEIENTNIDARWNLVPLCPKHHKEIHLSKESVKRDNIEKLLSSYEENRQEKFLVNLKREIAKEDQQKIFELKNGDSLNERAFTKFLIKKQINK